MAFEGDSQSLEECAALLEAANRELFQSNAFRITGLSVQATAREIAKQEDKLKRLEGLERLGITSQAEKLKLMEQLGMNGTGYSSAFALKVPPAVDQIRGAFQKLNKSPERRLIDEFFWFWPVESGQAASDSAIQALAGGNAETVEQIWMSAEAAKGGNIVARHNLAVLWHLRALDLENDGAGPQVDAKRRSQIEATWRNALKRWEALTSDDALWEKVVARIRQIDDARLTTGFGRRMRFTFRQALNKINAELALAYAKARNMDLANAHVRFMRETGQSPEDVAKAGALVLAPMMNRLREQLPRAEEKAAANPQKADEPARDVIAGAHALVEPLDLFFGQAEHPAKDLLDDAAGAGNYCIATYRNSTRQDAVAAGMFEQVLPLAKSDSLRDLISDNIRICRGNLQRELRKLLEDMGASTATPSERLKQFQTQAVPYIGSAFAGLEGDSPVRNELLNKAASVLRQIGVEAWNKFNDKATALTANELALQYAQDSELKKTLTEFRDIYLGKVRSTGRKRPAQRTPPTPRTPPKKSKFFGAVSGVFLFIFRLIYYVFMGAVYIYGFILVISIIVSVITMISSCHPRTESSSNAAPGSSDAATALYYHAPPRLSSPDAVVKTPAADGGSG